MLILLINGTYGVWILDGFIWHMAYIPSFMKINGGFQAVLRFILRNLRGCNTGSINGRGLLV
jgi:hypothetical protein